MPISYQETVPSCRF